MTHRQTIIEQAFALADSGTCASVTEIRRVLQSRGLGPNQIRLELYGPSLTADLRRRCERALAAVAATAEA